MRYTIGTLVTNWDEYDKMKDSFIKNGFTEDCEFITVDNTKENTKDAFSGNNWILNNANGEYVILCHQDVRVKYDSRKTLDNRIESLPSDWGLAGNAGGITFGVRALRITDPYGFDQKVGGPFPRKVQTLDGNFIIVRKDARLGFSRDLSGFHFYDADICMHCEQMGYGIYVIDFHLQHLGQGTIDSVFEQNKVSFQKKWSKFLRGKIIQLTTVAVHL